LKTRENGELSACFDRRRAAGILAKPLISMVSNDDT